MAATFESAVHSATGGASPVGDATLAKRAALMEALQNYGSVMVAYSGGVDSAYLVSAACEALGRERVLAVLADSPSLARSQMRDAVAFAEEQRVPLLVVKTNELEDEAYTRNDAQRCFHCKDELFGVMEAERLKTGHAVVVYGLNADDTQDFRPGHGAAGKHHVQAPLADALLTKVEVRLLSAAAGLRVWDKPASACLSSRIEYGREVTREALEQVECAEDSLRALGLVRFRVRHHGAVARIEIAAEEMTAWLTPQRFKDMSDCVRRSGFAFVAVDCDGYRSGAMNEVLPFAVLLAAAEKKGAG